MIGRGLLFWTCLCLGWFISYGCSGDPVDPLLEEGADGLEASRLPFVEDFEPGSAIQGSRFPLHVHGQNFDEGSRVDLLLSGGVIGEVQTLSTRFVTPEELIADISIADSAPIGAYSVQVTTSGGKRGIPIEDFKVTVDSTHTVTDSIPAVELAFGVYDLTARIESFDPAWGIDLEGAFYTAVITLSGFGGTFADWRFIGGDGEAAEIGVGRVSGFADLQGEVVINVDRLLWSMEGRMLDSGAMVGSWGCCGHISGTFTALRRQGPPEVGSVTLLPDHLTVAVYDTAQLTVIVRDTNGAVIANPDVVFFVNGLWDNTVDSTGFVTGLPGGCGTGTVIARSQGVDSNTAHITVGTPSGEGCWDY